MHEDHFASGVLDTSMLILHNPCSFDSSATVCFWLRVQWLLGTLILVILYVI